MLYYLPFKKKNLSLDPTFTISYNNFPTSCKGKFLKELEMLSMDNPSPRPHWTHYNLAFIPFAPQHAHVIITSGSHITRSHGQFPVAVMLATDPPHSIPKHSSLNFMESTFPGFPPALVAMHVSFLLLFCSKCWRIQGSIPGPSLSSSSVCSLADLLSHHGFIYHHIGQPPEL